MVRRDARQLTPSAQQEVRRQAVALHQAGLKKGQIALQLEVHRNTVGKWLARHENEGMKALEARKRGPKAGNSSLLSATEQSEIRKAITDKCPEQLKLPFALWTREAVGRLIEERTGKRLDPRQVGRFLKLWGFTPQRPVKQAYQRNDEAVKKWLEEVYPAIKAVALQEDAEIQWLDESGIKSHDHRGRGYAPKGKTPVRKHNPCGEKINKISSITNQGKLRFMCYEGSFNYRTYHKFLSRLIKDADGRKIHVIADNLRVHHSKVIKRWARRYRHLIELHHLPSYCPDLNPDEYLNCDLKTELAKRPERRDKGKWAKTVEETLQQLATQPERIRKYFKAGPIQYAA
jgi:transposase